MWLLLLYVAVAGAIGGVVNALVTEKGFFLPSKERVDDAITIYRPGWIGNVVIGALAATISWGLYGPLAAYFIAGTVEALKTNTAPDKIGLTLSSLVGAALIGVGGARWLTNEVDKSLLKAAASKAASAPSSPSASQQIALASPTQALNIAKNLKRGTDDEGSLKP
jgi:hypothetical protein